MSNTNLKNKKKQWYNVSKTKKNKVPGWKAKKYYTKHSHQKAPAWSAKTRYTKNENVNPPAFVTNKYYVRNDSSAPRAERQMFDVICDGCGRPTQVPFQPRGDRPVYCRECFEAQKNNY